MSLARLAYPPAWFILSLALAYAFAWFRPSPWPTGIADIAHPLGYVSLLIGVGFFGGAVLAFRRHATPIMPFESPTRLIERGVFRLTRNPIYLGELFILAGVCLRLGETLPWLALPVFFAVLNWVTIPWEETACRRSFGSAYDAYHRRTRRWL